eukprot:8551706-Pyramimonas_sp.AAC.1
MFLGPPTLPGRPRQSEEGIGIQYHLKGLMSIHPSREAPPEQGRYRDTKRITSFRAHPTPPKI